MIQITPQMKVYVAIEPVVFYDETLRPRINCGPPFNLLAPIDWLIRQVGS